MASGIRGMKFGACDEAAREVFPRASPSGEAIQRFLSAEAYSKAPSHRCFYDAGHHTAAYVTAWRGRAVCLMALRVTAVQAARIESRLKKAGVLAWTSLRFFQDSVEAALGESISPGRPRGIYISRWWRPEQPGVATAIT